MAHTFDTSVRNPATANTYSTANPLDTSYTPGAGATVIVVTIAYVGAANSRSGGDPTLVEDSLTFLQADTVRRGPAPEGSAELWYLLAPPTGSAKTIRVPNAGGFQMVVTVSSYKAQSGYTSELDVAAGVGAQTANPSVDITTNVDGDVIVAGIFSDDNGWAPSARSGTQLYDDDNGTWGEGAQYLLQATAGLQAMGWTEATAADHGLIAAAFKEVASGGDATKTVTDSATGADSIGGLAVSLALSETGAGSESFSGAVSLGLTDSGSGADALAAVLASLSITDAGVGVDMPAILAALGLTEDGSGTDSIYGISVSLSLAEFGTGTDLVAVLTAMLKQVADSGSGTDGLVVNVAVAVSDIGSGAEAVNQVLVTLTVTDAGAGAELVNVLTGGLVSILDIGAGVDGISIAVAPLSMADSGSGADSLVIQAVIGLSETATGADAVSTLQAAYKLVSELATGTDAIGNVSVSLAIPESGAGSDLIGQILAWVMLAETGTGVDVAVAFDSAVRIATITFSIARRTIDFSFTSREMEFSLTQREIEFELN